MEARDTFDIIYLVLIVAINGIAFFIIAICYARMYLSLDKKTRHAASNVSRGEMTVAKKMALLVFTNFVCWAPIAFFGLTALAGYVIIIKFNKNNELINLINNSLIKLPTPINISLL